MFTRLHCPHYRAQSIALCAMLLMLWLNVAYVDHHLDTNPAHHAQHHCQLFSGFQNGLSSALPILPAVSGSEIRSSVEKTQRRPSVHYAYLARSPPHF
ncbi:DUF2607 domain-containing protein [Vibrio anguillarum]|uniref:DUF2607 family protein n=1 Tax=Vibrio anguillarum TaxID=55601 RepID=UPI00188B6482|nr:DUF2607 family protein [Vibrio anguillarum]MBF4246227.1 DUF2607 domain-containing protein [Vibrio anguillarum]MBF4256362.1 DUF2607 domain-containing protein [Vibrio anguillarum]MBF4276934.1 DUF2607 domain-containing protein [Vibrio anguillarum]MBF4297282.1 DUF2607 domain-containing protein [Vibrio anguillarum]MBF4360979.1 DUF2607 domain-containing protein [Vibrio anguillarum]